MRQESQTVLAIPDVELVDNLTVRASHTDVASAARSAGLLLGVAPNTVLGANIQTARRLGRSLASADLGYHILDTMISMDESIRTGQSVEVVSGIGCRSWTSRATRTQRRSSNPR